MSRYCVRAAVAAALLAISPAFGQHDEAADYPNRPVKIIVSVPAGGGVDTVTRIFAAGLQQRLGQHGRGTAVHRAQRRSAHGL